MHANKNKIEGTVFIVILIYSLVYTSSLKKTYYSARFYFIHGTNETSRIQNVCTMSYVAFKENLREVSQPQKTCSSQPRALHGKVSEVFGTITPYTLCSLLSFAMIA